MKLLWIPHNRLRQGARTRAEYLIERMPGHEHRLLNWSTVGEALPGVNAAAPLGSRTYETVSMTRLPNLSRPLWRMVDRDDRGRWGHFWPNQYLFRRTLRRLIEEWRPDAVILSANASILGELDYGDLKRHGIKLVFDYSDGDTLAGPYVTGLYRRVFAAADAVICVSDALVEQAKENGGRAYYVPNGIDRTTFMDADGASVRARWKLGDRIVVSLIGLTGSFSLYFVDALRDLIQERLPVAALFVGDGPMAGMIKHRIGGSAPGFIMTGAVPFAEIPGYFAATDIGLYPAEQTPYFLNASPIKVFEYAYCGKSVLVAPRLPEVESYALPGVHFSEPDRDAFANAIRELAAGIRKKDAPPADHLEAHDWTERAERLETILHEIGAGTS